MLAHVLSGETDYLLNVQPIFNNHCSSCHAGTFGSGVLELDSYDRLIEGDSNNGPVVIPFNADSSLLYRVLLRDSVIVPNEPICCRMPKNGDPLPISQQTTIYNWINEGARGPTLSARSDKIYDRSVVSIAPNPFNNLLKISFAGDVYKVERITILNILGQKIKTIEIQLNNQNQSSVIWDGRNDFGQTVPAGIYFIYFYQNYKIESIQKVLFLK